MKSVAATALLHVLLLAALAAPARAQAEPPSFAGKQIKLLIGYSPTGYGYDTYGRLLARHLGKYLSGNPVIVPQNRPGAGSLNLANYLYNAAPRDGSEIAIVGRGVAMEPLIGVRSLIVCGESTSGCVRASVVDGYSSGFHVTLVEECTFDRAELTHKVNLFDLAHKYADVMHVDEVIAHLDGLGMARAAE